MEKNVWNQNKEYFNLETRSDSGHDHVKNGNTLEQKSARWHGNGNDWKWQHIEMTHHWDYLLLCGLDFNNIKYYIASRKIVEDLIKNGIITGQGKKDENGVKLNLNRHIGFQDLILEKKIKILQTILHQLIMKKNLFNI